MHDLHLLKSVEEDESQGKKEGFSDRKGEGKRSCTGNWNSGAPP